MGTGWRRGFSLSATLVVATLMSSACGGSSSDSVHLPAGVTKSFLGRVQWAHTRCPHIAVGGFTCPFAYAIVLAYYAHPSGEFKVANPTTHHTIVMSCSKTTANITCMPLQGNLSNSLSFTGPSPNG